MKVHTDEFFWYNYARINGKKPRKGSYTPEKKALYFYLKSSQRINITGEQFRKYLSVVKVVEKGSSAWNSMTRSDTQSMPAELIFKEARGSGLVRIDPSHILSVMSDKDRFIYLPTEEYRNTL